MKCCPPSKWGADRTTWGLLTLNYEGHADLDGRVLPKEAEGGVSPESPAFLTPSWLDYLHTSSYTSNWEMILQAQGPDGFHCNGFSLKILCWPPRRGIHRHIHHGLSVSLVLSVIPTCYKKATIFQMPKKSPIFCLNVDCYGVFWTDGQIPHLLVSAICPIRPPAICIQRHRSTDNAIKLALHARTAMWEWCSSTTVQHSVP